MIWFAFFGAAVALSYWAGRNSPGYGVAVFLASVALWQVVNDGPGSFLELSDCNYGHAARDC